MLRNYSHVWQVVCSTAVHFIVNLLLNLSSHRNTSINTNSGTVVLFCTFRKPTLVNQKAMYCTININNEMSVNRPSV